MNWVSLLFRKFSGSLSRITSGGNFIPEIDGLRFIAIFPVVLHHLLGTYIVLTKKMELTGGFNWQVATKHSWLVHLISHGNYGVQVFFVISGFILALPFARKHFGISSGPSMNSYFLRRVSRLEPTYIINLSVILVVFVYGWGVSAVTILPNFFASLFYMHNQIFAEVSKISDVTWSLEVEIQFYILAPLLSLIFKVPGNRLRRSILIAFIVIGASLPPYSTPRLSLSLINSIQYFLCGFLLADLFILDWRERPEKNMLGDCIAFAGLSLIGCFLFEIINFKSMLPISILIFFIGVFKGTVSNYIFTRRGFVVIGGMCYTIYLYHNIIISLTLPKFIQAFPEISSGKELLSGFPVILMLLLPFILLVCSVLFALFERPFMKKEWYKFKRIESVVPAACFKADVEG